MRRAIPFLCLAILLAFAGCEAGDEDWDSPPLPSLDKNRQSRPDDEPAVAGRNGPPPAGKVPASSPSGIVVARQGALYADPNETYDLYRRYLLEGCPAGGDSWICVGGSILLDAGTGRAFSRGRASVEGGAGSVAGKAGVEAGR